MLPAEAVVEIMNVTMPKTGEAVSKAVAGKEGYKLIVVDEEYVRFAGRWLWRVLWRCSLEWRRWYMRG